MVCDRCKLVVSDILNKMGVHDAKVELGKTCLPNTLSGNQMSELRKRLEGVGFEIIDDLKSRLIEKIKIVILEMVYGKQDFIKVNYSVYLEKKLGKSYHYLSNLFSEVEGQTIEKYIISQKIERVKELLVYEQLTLSEIAYELGYSSVSHLSVQFKKVTGLTPSHFKEIGLARRIPIDKV